jgi:hypothetical protein
LTETGSSWSPSGRCRPWSSCARQWRNNCNVGLSPPTCAEEGEERDARILVIAFDASVHGWAEVLRMAQDETCVEVVGGYRTAVDLLGSAFIILAALPDCLAAQVYRETLAGFLATQAAGKLYPLADHTVLIRSDCLGAIAALWKGSFRSLALQNIVLLHNRLFMDHRGGDEGGRC